MGSVDKIFDDVSTNDTDNDDAAERDVPAVIDGAWLAERLLAGTAPIRSAAAALRCQAREIALLRRDFGLEHQS